MQGLSASAFSTAYAQGVPGVKVNISGSNSRADAESKTSYTRVQFTVVQELMRL